MSLSDQLGTPSVNTANAQTVSVPPAPGRTYVPLKIKKGGPVRQAKKKLDTDQIVAITLFSVLLVGVFFMVLAFVGVFNEDGPSVSLTPTVTEPAPGSLPVTVTIA